MFGLILLVMLNIKEYQVYQLEILFQRTIMKFIKIYPSRSFFSFFLFGATPVAYGSSQARGQIRAAAASQSNPQLQQHWIWVTSATYAIAHSNTRSLTHWARPGIQPASSWTLCQALNPLNHNGNANGYNFFFFFWLLRGIWSSRARGQIWGAVATYTAAVFPIHSKSKGVYTLRFQYIASSKHTHLG